MYTLKVLPPFGDDTTYFRRLRSSWEFGRSFVNVEHDIVIRAKDVASLQSCPRDWCAAPYPYLDRPRQFGLGLVKFSAALIARHPSMFEEIGMWSNDSHPPKHWCSLDAWIYQYLIRHGEDRCEDHDLVGHLGHPGKCESSHGCFSIRKT